MHRDNLIFRSCITALVCLLILGIISLATHAKISQYESRRGVTSYLSKSTKMSDSGQRAIALPQPLVVLLYAEEVRADFVPPAEEPPRPPCLGFLAAFHFRPPPPAA